MNLDQSIQEILLAHDACTNAKVSECARCKKRLSSLFEEHSKERLLAGEKRILDRISSHERSCFKANAPAVIDTGQAKQFVIEELAREDYE